MTTHPLPLYDRSRVVEDWNCPRARFWHYEFGGRGLTRSTTAIELYLGITVHDAVAAIATLTSFKEAISIDAIAGAAYSQIRQSLEEPDEGPNPDDDYIEEQAVLAEGLVRGFYKHVWPRLMESYPEILFVEKEMTYPHDLKGQHSPDQPDLLFMSKPDLILTDGQGEAVYFEYKTTSSKKEDWINSWDTAVQLHSTIRAVKATTGVDISNVIVQGLYKGYRAYNKQSSPFCYAYFKRGNPPFSSDQISYEFKAGFKRTPVWELDGGIKQWVEDMPDQILTEQFPQTPPIFINDSLVDSFFRQRAKREYEIATASALLKDDLDQDLLDRVFPQRFDKCQPGWGSPCQFRTLCHGYVEDPLSEGYQFRESHHQLEAERHTNEDTHS